MDTNRHGYARRQTILVFGLVVVFVVAVICLDSRVVKSFHLSLDSQPAHAHESRVKHVLDSLDLDRSTTTTESNATTATDSNATTATPLLNELSDVNNSTANANTPTATLSEPATPKPTTTTQTPTPTVTNATTLPTTAPVDKPPRWAYMLYATDDRTVCNAIIMAHNIRRTGTPMSIPIVTLVSKTVSTDRIQRLRDAHIQVELVDLWSQQYTAGSDYWSDSLTKLYIFQERGYDRVIYLDSDAWVHRNLDHLFSLGDAILWAPRAYYLGEKLFFGSTLLVISPSNAAFQKIKDALASHAKQNYFDMDVLNDLWRLDCGYLPSHYVVLTPTIVEEPTFGFANRSERINKTYVHHFTMGYGLHKPWLTQRYQLENRNPDFEPLFYDLFFMYYDAAAELCPWL
ncbi:hypothetical protein LEN26_006231 [Aphanomyces euteiches]|nr:hypothetical protein AeMF1_004285 [Aphanomyces euteiches]KAH9136235.1 hypothetical protein LEN26_006231 [Aphanomyces euteiches]KAH9196070.1 hypothetical protein AeNC1_001929 [Aphanomyces euteiches]